jgi:hypothetical protein
VLHGGCHVYAATRLSHDARHETVATGAVGSKGDIGMKRILSATVAGLVMATGAVSFAEAQQRTQRPPAELTIINNRTVQLTALEIASMGDNPRLVGRIARPVDPGKSVKIRLTRPQGCTFVVLARFSDDSDNDQEGVNLCGEKQIRLID